MGGVSTFGRGRALVLVALVAAFDGGAREHGGGVSARHAATGPKPATRGRLASSRRQGQAGRQCHDLHGVRIPTSLRGHGGRVQDEVRDHGHRQPQRGQRPRRADQRRGVDRQGGRGHLGRRPRSRTSTARSRTAGSSTRSARASSARSSTARRYMFGKAWIIGEAVLGKAWNTQAFKGIDQRHPGLHVLELRAARSASPIRASRVVHRLVPLGRGEVREEHPHRSSRRRSRRSTRRRCR